MKKHKNKFRVDFLITFFFCCVSIAIILYFAIEFIILTNPSFSIECKNHNPEIYNDTLQFKNNCQKWWDYFNIQELNKL